MLTVCGPGLTLKIQGIHHENPHWVPLPNGGIQPEGNSLRTYSAELYIMGAYYALGPYCLRTPNMATYTIGAYTAGAHRLTAYTLNAYTRKA